ncbi:MULTISPECIES: hypothetical protein [unclassified Mesorhizobium]|uniref:hypothetical protein n=1 Tax=unclassified Mesorhizobium TaxID=325217 RepID=UPI000FCC5CD9|nr:MULTISPECIES: hypothetical protein [unclassified Mesorhizobium]TGP34051.1 hypothetical protein EN875_012435 [Mesorhizobium sp. M2D.F.Ca.ET.232.01.1.1]TGQ44082.1 hypothetical protein EN863_014630 [Mesorhizobium sp. M00.F.Ca.ET.220.01.1.1]TGT97593.1 hypothetical protein EN806_48730 [bacterium M00.F.Ca.ET.163.01.1.1]
MTDTSTSDTALVERLNDGVCYNGSQPTIDEVDASSDVMREAAARLTAMQAERDRLHDDKQPMADESGKMTAAEDVLAWLIIEKIGVPDDQTYTPHEAQQIITNALEAGYKAEGETGAISAAISSVRFMDPPDGGDVSLSEQVSRMREALDSAEAAIARAGEAVLFVRQRDLDGSWNSIPASKTPDDKMNVPLYLGPALASPSDREVVAVTDEMVEAALQAYADAIDTPAEGLRVHEDWLKPSMRAALTAALSEEKGR